MKTRLAALAACVWLVPVLGHADVLRPEGGGPSLEDVVLAAQDGDVVEIPPGTWLAHLRITHAITLRGAGGVIDGGGASTVITVEAPGVVLDHVHAQNSGSDLGAPDACVYTSPTAVGVVVRDGRFEDCAFGIYVHRSNEAQIERNLVIGRAAVREPDRGNGIHLFDAQRVMVRGNEVRGSRDGIFVAATNDSHFLDNHIDHVRYGIHYMWSHRNVLRANVVSESLTGFALMQSNDLVVEDNVMAHNRRSGLLLRDTRGCVVRHNELLGNGQGLFVYNSEEDRLEENFLVHNTVGAKIWGALVTRDEVVGNAFVGNARQIFYFGNRDMVWGQDGPGNHFSDYLGWDQDGDGTGDRPYRVDSLGAVLVEQYPAAALLLRSPALELLVHLEQRMPVLRTFTLVDRSPQIEAPAGVERAIARAAESLERSPMQHAATDPHQVDGPNGEGL